MAATPRGSVLAVVASSVPGPSDLLGRTALPTRAACLLLAALSLGCGARSELPDRLTEGVPDSCATIHAEKPTLPSGAYQLDTAGVVWRTYCDMDHDGGGWTLLLKTDGRAQTFAFDAPIWTCTAAQNSSLTIWRRGASTTTSSSAARSVRTLVPPA